MRNALGIDIGGTKVAAGIINENGDLIQKEMIESDASDREKMFSQVCTCVDNLLDHSSIPLADIHGIGVGVPGKVDTAKGMAVFQNNLPWSNFPVAERLQQRFSVDRISVDNDVYMAAYAEWKKAEMPQDSIFIYVTISTGISCSIIQNGEFIRGAGFAGELGLIPVVETEVEGKLERLEKVASGPAVARKAQELYNNANITTAEVFDLFYKGDEKAQKIVEQAAFSIAQGIYMLNSIIDPQKIVFGGSVAIYNPMLIELIKDKLRLYLLDEQKHILNGIDNCHLKNDQGIIGAGLKVLAAK
ncbi:ROK family protein [Virgibacillus halodenitrificans]|uniref:ROK family protein n=1 Tax=Virgibacillus halodenitrificans TaxID=1482 RepID=UPI000EF4A3E5|nr:ROK family protein [Virgibacillus halodenitrificans]